MLIKETVMSNDLVTLMTGKESYPVMGPHKRKDVRKVTRCFQGLPLYGACVEKNYLAQRIYHGTLVFGAMRVMSAANGGAYGFDFNPPLELHAWLDMGNGVIFDFALPGVILNGMRLRDEEGPYVEGRTPSILMDVPPDWLLYHAYQTMEYVST